MIKNTQVIFSLFLFLLQGHRLFSQRSRKGMLEAEKTFAAFTGKQGIRDDFLNYMDSAGLVLRNGTALNAIETYREQNPDRPSLAGSRSLL